VLVEAHYNIEKITKNKRLATDAIKSILNKFEIINIDHNLIFEALKRTEKHDLKIFDLIHYTTALLNGCFSIISYDKHFDNLEIERILFEQIKILSKTAFDQNFRIKII